MTRHTPLSGPYLLGFEEMERIIDRLSQAAGAGYPPYNIERLPGDETSLNLRIVLAVAGFTLEELEVTLEASQLIVRGQQKDKTDDETIYLHRGIATRQFQRSFLIAEGVEILGASLKNGLLSIDVVKRLKEPETKRISITRDGKE